MKFGEYHEKKVWKPVTLKEFDDFVGVLLYAGLRRSKHEPTMELWGRCVAQYTKLRCHKIASCV